MTFSPGLRGLARYPGIASYFYFPNPERVDGFPRCAALQKIQRMNEEATEC